MLTAIVVLVLCACASAQAPPADWVDRINGGQMMYIWDDSNVSSSMMPSVANGYVGTTVGSDTIFIAGVFNGLNSAAPSHRARIPGVLGVSLSAPGMQPAGCALDIERATYYRRSTVNGAQIEMRFYAHREIMQLLVCEVHITMPSGTASFDLSFAYNTGADSTDIAFGLPVQQPQNAVTFTGSINTPEEPGGEVVNVTVATFTPFTTLNITGNQTRYILAAFSTSIESNDTTTAALKTLYHAMNHANNLHETHKATWRGIWEAGVEVRGRLDVAQAINASLYYILSSVTTDRVFSLSPGGLASNGYNGHTFWDCETWMYPSLAVLHPEIAGSLLRYRVQRIPGAQKKAQSYNMGWQGAMFPWESAFTGQEVCPSWAGTGLREQHITGDIAFAAAQYWWATGNMTWLQNEGYPLLEQIAIFWASRATMGPGPGQRSINDIIPPDEYADHVNNSVYTNVVASRALEFATNFSRIVGKQPDPLWLEVAQQLVILFNETAQMHPEYAGYAGQEIKQADVILLGFPLMYPMSAQVRQNDLNYYASRTDGGGPAMTWGMQAIGYLDTKDYAGAASNFNRSFANVQEPFKVWTETPTGGTVNFITGAGGFLQGVVYGYPGMRLSPEGVTLRPILIEGTTFHRVRGWKFQDSTIDYSYDATTFTVIVTHAGKTSLALDTSQGTQPLVLGTPIVVPYSVGDTAFLHTA